MLSARWIAFDEAVPDLSTQLHKAALMQAWTRCITIDEAGLSYNATRLHRHYRPDHVSKSSFLAKRELDSNATTVFMAMASQIRSQQGPAQSAGPVIASRQQNIPPASHTNNINGNIVQRKPVPSSSKAATSKDRFENAFSDVVLAASAVVLPMLILTAAFIGVVFHLKVAITRYESTNSLFHESMAVYNDSAALESAYFVAIDSARLVTIASWTSTAIAFLPPWLMMMYSYKAADSFRKAKPRDLPSPFQLWLLIDLFSGSYGSLWNWSRYRWSSSKRSRANVEVKKAVVVSMIGMVLGILILLADTWLHLTTTNVLLQHNVPAPASSHLFSRDLMPACHQSPDNCTTAPREYNSTNVGTVLNASAAYRTLFNISSTTTVLSSTLGGEQYLMYTPAQVPQNMSFRASTIAMKVQCKPITRACHLHASEPHLRNITSLNRLLSLQYFCSPAYAGDMTNALQVNTSIFGYDGMYSTTFFKDSALAETVTFSEDQYLFLNYQPMYMVTGASGIPADRDLLDDPEILEVYIDNAGFFLECTSQFVRMNYSLSNGYAQDVEIAPADDNAIIAITLPFILNQAWAYVQSGMRQACLEKTADDMAASFARSYAHTILSVGSGAVEPAPALQASTMRLEQISRLPKAPFFTLLTLNCIYAILGIGLAITALASKPSSIKPVQARLSGVGLVASLFEGQRAEKLVYRMEDLFAENVPGPNLDFDRASLLQTDQLGWQFKTVKP